VLSGITDAAGQESWLRALILIGSLADDTADALSDLDLLVIVHEGRFAAAWASREALHATAALYSWDQFSGDLIEVAAHRWLTPDLVLVEALFATASSGLRIAPPYLVVTGDRDAPTALTPRAPIERSEMEPGKAHPVEAAYDEFKTRLRGACR
jgi:hypothetical protein